MSPTAALLVLAAIVVAATIAGIVLRRRDGRARAVHVDAIDPASLALPAGVFGERATLVQFSTELCARCPGVHRLLVGIADERDGVAHVDVDLTHRPDLSARFHVLQTPTTLVLDGDGVARARIAGAPSRHTVERALDALEGTARV